MTWAAGTSRPAAPAACTAANARAGVVVELRLQRRIGPAAAPQAALDRRPVVGEAFRLGKARERVVAGVVQPVGAPVPGHAEGRAVGVRPAADPILRFEHDDREPELARAAGGRKAGGAGADHDQIEARSAQGVVSGEGGRPAFGRSRAMPT